jgi:hypothetical protein
MQPNITYQELLNRIVRFAASRPSRLAQPVVVEVDGEEYVTDTITDNNGVPVIVVRTIED